MILYLIIKLIISYILLPGILYKIDLIVFSYLI
jgi:hypothetical protein